MLGYSGLGFGFNGVGLIGYRYERNAALNLAGLDPEIIIPQDSSNSSPHTASQIFKIRVLK